MDSSMLDQMALPKDKAHPSKTKLKIPRHKIGEKFLKGPIPFNWLCKAAQLPGKSFHVAIVIWFLVGLNKSSTVKLNQSVLTKFGVTRHSKYRALDWLSDAGLIAVEEAKGKNPLVTVLPVLEAE